MNTHVCMWVCVKMYGWCYFLSIKNKWKIMKWEISILTILRGCNYTMCIQGLWNSTKLKTKIKTLTKKKITKNESNVVLLNLLITLSYCGRILKIFQRIRAKGSGGCEVWRPQKDRKSLSFSWDMLNEWSSTDDTPLILFVQLTSSEGTYYKRWRCWTTYLNCVVNFRFYYY